MSSVPRFSPSLSEPHEEGGEISLDVSLSRILPYQRGGFVRLLLLLPLVLHHAAYASPFTWLHDIEIAL